jgi:hypothetical protein
LFSFYRPYTSNFISSLFLFKILQTYTQFHPYIWEGSSSIACPGRGILLDYAEWAAAQSPPITYSTFSTHSIPASTLLAIAKDHSVTPRRGDILFIRTGVIPEWESMSDRQRKDYAAQKEPEHAGVEASLDVLAWLWDTGITAVASDAISWEVSDFLFLVLSYSNPQPCNKSTTRPLNNNAGISHTGRSLNP